MSVKVAIMSRIDANLAIPMADAIRPQAHAEDHQAHQQVSRSRVGVQSTEAPGTPPSADDVNAAAEQVRQVIEVASGRHLSFEMDDSGKTLLFKITSQQGETIKQIPSQDVLELRNRIDAMVGALVDQKA